VETVRWVHLESPEASVAQYLSRRYHVADEAVRPLVLAAREAGRESQLDPLLILAVMAVESSLNPFAESEVGAQGLMQVMTSVHATRFGLDGDLHNALEPVANIRVGSAILSDAIRRGGSVERGLQLYVGAGNLRDDGGYGSRVLAEMARLKMAASGDVVAALASAGVRPDGRTAVAVPPAVPRSVPASLTSSAF
jgi:soluble lytic murein transglycosylase-like protein